MIQEYILVNEEHYEADIYAEIKRQHLLFNDCLIHDDILIMNLENFLYKPHLKHKT
jgi:hypothetical protein